MSMLPQAHPFILQKGVMSSLVLKHLLPIFLHLCIEMWDAVINKNVELCHLQLKDDGPIPYYFNIKIQDQRRDRSWVSSFADHDCSACGAPPVFHEASGLTRFPLQTIMLIERLPVLWPK